MIDRGEPRVFYGWWVALAFAVIIFLSTGIRFAVGPFLKPMAADLGLGAAFAVWCTLLLVGAGLSLTIRASGTGRPAPRPAPAPREARSVAGGR